MSSVKEKAENWLNANIIGWTPTQLKKLTLLLKIQDRDTRHACADAVTGYPNYVRPQRGARR